MRRKNDVTDRQTDRQNDRQRDYSMPRGSAHRGIMTNELLYASWLRPPRHNKREPGRYCTRMRLIMGEFAIILSGWMVGVTIE